LLNSLRPIMAVFGHLLVLCCVVHAQTPHGAGAPKVVAPPSATVDKSPEARVEESRPSIFYLPDKQDNLQPILDFKYEDFVELYKLKNQLGGHDRPPRYSLQRVSATATATPKNIKLTARFQVLVHDKNWVRVPLRFDQGLLREAAQYKGPGEQFLHYEGKGVGYVCWIRGEPASRHELTLTMLVPVDTIGDKTRLKLFAPRSTISELKLTVPIAGATGTVSEGATMLSSTTAEGGTTEFDVVGLKGDFQLTWRKSATSPPDAAATLEVVGTVLARLDGHAISTEATLSVRSHDVAFDRLTVRLPPEAELVRGDDIGYVLSTVGEKTKDDAKQSPRFVEVRLPKKTLGPVEIRVRCQRNYDPSKNASWCELAGLEVVGAARQWGTIAVAAIGDWQLHWGPGRQSRQIDYLSDSPQHENVVASFEYFSQPYSLPVRMTRQKTRISVDPEYVLSVDCDRIRLKGKLAYTIRGAKVSALEVAIPGWELLGVGPDALVADDGATTTSDTVSIPLASPSSGSVELQLRARRTIASATSLSIPLPIPQADSMGPASVVILAADNVELIPNNQAIKGLMRQGGAPPIELPSRQQDPLYYRSTGDAAVFAAGFRVHARRMTVDVDSQATLGEQVANVEQKFSYSIAYEPLDRLNITVPRMLAGPKRLQVLYDGKPLLPVVATNDVAKDGAAGPVTMRLTLPTPRIGECELAIRYSVAMPNSLSERPTTLALPLTMPKDGELVANRLIVKSARNLLVSPRKGEWIIANRDAVAKSDNQPVLQLTSDHRPCRLDVDLLAKNDATTAIVVSRAWLQSRLTSTSRQGRAVFQLNTNRKSLGVLLPTGALADQAIVLVNGTIVDGRTTENNQLTIPLVGDGRQRRFVVELRYHFSEPRPPRGALSLEFPRLIPDAWIEQMYWQLILPDNEHLIANPAGFTREFAWKWNNYFWRRHALLDQTQLESWAGTTPHALPPKRANGYLFSTLGRIERAEVRTAGRTWIVLWASGAALVVGLLLIYVPVSRHPATLLIAGIALLTVGLIAPEPTLMLAQAASLGLVLALLAGLLERGVVRRRWKTTRKEPSSSRVELGSNHAIFHQAVTGSPASTETMPTAQPPSTRNVPQ